MEHISIKQHIEKAIEEGKVRMKPRWRFMCTSVLTVIATAVTVFLILFIVSFIFFSLHEATLHSLPWMLMVVALICLMLLETLIRKFPIGYRQPIAYSASAVLVLLLLGGLLISYTSFHRHLRERERGFYDMIGPREPELMRYR